MRKSGKKIKYDHNEAKRFAVFGNKVNYNK